MRSLQEWAWEWCRKAERSPQKACSLSVGFVLLRFVCWCWDVLKYILWLASVEITQLVDGRQCDIGFSSLDIIDRHSSEFLTPGYFVDTPIMFGKPFPKRIKGNQVNHSNHF